MWGMNTRAKKIACWSVVMGTIVVVDVGLLNRNRILEELFLYGLHHADAVGVVAPSVR